MPITAPIVVGPATYVYIDIDASDPTSALLTIIKDDTETFKLAQSGVIQTLGSLIESELEGMTD